MMRVRLDEKAFRALVAGKVITDRRADVEIILSDIGWPRMLRAIEDAMNAQNPPDPPEAREFLARRTRRP